MFLDIVEKKDRVTSRIAPRIKKEILYMNNQYLFIGNGEGIHTIGDNIDHWINSDELADIFFVWWGNSERYFFGRKG